MSMIADRFSQTRGLAAVRDRAEEVMKGLRTPLPSVPLPTMDNPITKAAIDYDNTMRQNGILKAQLNDMERERNEALDTAQAWKDEADELKDAHAKELQHRTGFLRTELSRVTAERDELKAQTAEFASTISSIRSVASALLEMSESAENWMRAQQAKQVQNHDDHDDPPPANNLEPVHAYDERVNPMRDIRLPTVNLSE